MTKTFRTRLSAIAATLALAATTSASAAMITPTDVTFEAGPSTTPVQSLGAAVTDDLYVWFELTMQSGTVNSNDFVGLQLLSSANPSADDNINIGFKGNGNVGPDSALDYFVRTAFTSNIVYAAPNAQVGQSVWMYGHVYKDSSLAGGASGNFNVFDLFMQSSEVADPVAVFQLFETTPDAQSIGNSGVSVLDGFAFRDDFLDQGDTWVMSDIHIAYDVPEPGSLWLLGAAGIAGLLGKSASRRRRKA